MIKTDFNNEMEDCEKYAKTRKAAKWVKRILEAAILAAGALFTANQINKNSSKDQESETEEEDT